MASNKVPATPHWLSDGIHEGKEEKSGGGREKERKGEE